MTEMAMQMVGGEARLGGQHTATLSQSRSIQVERLSKSFHDHRTSKRLFEDLSFDLQMGEKLALLGRNGQGKSTLIKMLGGVAHPTSGRIRNALSTSWPIGFGGGFQGSLTGLDNVRFIARLYSRPAAEILDYVEWFAELGPDLRTPVKNYSTGMRARLAFGLSLAIEFECYLIDEVMAVGDARFATRSHDELFVKRADRAFVIASHNCDFLRQICTRAIVIHQGEAKIFEDMDLAVDIYHSL